jgi:hypothetical protein
VKELNYKKDLEAKMEYQYLHNKKIWAVTDIIKKHNHELSRSLTGLSIMRQVSAQEKKELTL